jgi:tetratricopeptide (TPR) repeat protein
MANFLMKWLEKMAAKSNKGFAAFCEGKEIYFAFINKYGEEYGCGKNDPSLVQAYALYREAEHIAQQEERYHDVAVTHAELGKICELQCRCTDSIVHRKKAIELFEAMPELNDLDRETLRDSYMFLAFSYFHCGKTNEAREIAEVALEKYRAAKDPYGIDRLKQLLQDIETAEGSITK